MPTRILLDPNKIQTDLLEPAARALRAGRLVAFPTETVYGLGAHALDPQAVARIFLAKGRPANDPLIVHVLDLSEVEPLVAAIPPLARRLAEAFWPGPLTLIMPRGERVPLAVTAGLDSLALRAPAHPVARALLAAAALPVAAPSANRFGRTSPTSAAHVEAQLGDRLIDGLDYLIDGGPTTVGLESTVLDCRGDRPRLLRPGGLSLERLQAVVGEIDQNGLAPGEADDGRDHGPDPALGEGPEGAAAQVSPGAQLRHYAPQAPLHLVRGGETALDPASLAPLLGRVALALRAAGRRPGLLMAEEDLGYLDGTSGLDVMTLQDSGAVATSLPKPGSNRISVLALGPLVDLASVARALFAGLHAMDAMGVDCILARDFGSAGLGLAIRDRLSRAAEGRVIDLVGDAGTQKGEDPDALFARILAVLD
jgi:L-threonylcarbamoyladenylate synthase